MTLGFGREVRGLMDSGLCRLAQSPPRCLKRSGPLTPVYISPLRVLA